MASPVGLNAKTADNTSKRLVKQPKVYFLDTGLLCWLLGIRSGAQLLTSPFLGAVFETAVFGQLVRLFAHRGERPPLTFLRTADGLEVDFVAEAAGRCWLFEAKAAATPEAKHAAALQKALVLLGGAADEFPAFVVGSFEHSVALNRRVTAVGIGRRG